MAVYNLCQTVDPFIKRSEGCVWTQTEIESEVYELLMFISAHGVARTSYGTGSVSSDVRGDQRLCSQLWPTTLFTAVTNGNPCGGYNVRMDMRVQHCKIHNSHHSGEVSGELSNWQWPPRSVGLNAVVALGSYKTPCSLVDCWEVWNTHNDSSPAL
jgi:hypothetical protein